MKYISIYLMLFVLIALYFSPQVQYQLDLCLSINW